MGWTPAGEGHEVALVKGRVTARATSGRSAGRMLKTLPIALRDHPEVERLRLLAEWLDRHSSACLTQVDTWMVSSLPVPTALLARVWPDEAWQAALRDLVIVSDDPDASGFLRDVTDTGDLRIITLDGATARVCPRTVTLPHPVLLPRLEELRELAAELGVAQKVEQIHRATWHKPADLPERATEVGGFTGGEFPSRYALAGLAASLDYRISDGCVTCRVRDGGRTARAAVWIGAPYRDGATRTGPLSWQDEDGRVLPLREVGPVAWSEGMRMAAALHAARADQEGTDQEGTDEEGSDHE
ncbi:DUF4132 domain-containing protein [Streptomyces collinus]|uniref:DUF4132 domain-containing protein n=1 Tax=Streptomyces collinus TaxID=42684 RepID=UPI0033EE56A9